MRILHLLTMVLILLAPAARAAQVAPEVQQQLFEKVFGDAVRLDPAMVARVLAEESGKRHYLDRDGDGRPEEVWFIDTELKHPESVRPLLVRVIDEDGDLDMGGEPDQDSDLYVADWNADGRVDRVLDFTDNDGDGDVDAQGMYFVGDTHAYFGEPSLRVWMTYDTGDTNNVMFYRGYDYQQLECQWRCGFGPEETLLAFALPLSGDRWISFWENPFVWYDHDRDGSPEEVIRFSGVEEFIETYRHSMDADGDSSPGRSLRDYDCSISAWAQGSRQGRRGTSNLTIDPMFSAAGKLRGIPTMPSITWASAPAVGRNVIWERVQFTWVEDDHNVDQQHFHDTNERWEGVITMGHNDFPQIGGPHSGRFNQRFELILEPERPVRMYYHPVDQRIHLRDADRAWMEVDTDRDGQAEMRYEMADANGDGFIDTWRVDVDADGSFDDEWSAADGVAPDELGYDWHDLHARMSQVLPRVPQLLYAINLELERALASRGGAADPLAAQLERGMRGGQIEDWLAHKLVSSDESLRFFLDVLKDRRLVALRRLETGADFWRSLDAARAGGDLEGMLAALAKLNGSGAADPAAAYAAWTERLRALDRPVRVGFRTVTDKPDDNLMWESERVAYRIYDGQIDVFGKQELLAPMLAGVTWSGNYHQEQTWGMDSLLVLETGGLGGVTLIVDGEPYPVRNPRGEGPHQFSGRLLRQDHERVTVEYTARNAGPADAPMTVRYELTALAGRRDSAVTVTVEGGRPEAKIELGLEMIAMPQTLLHDTGLGVMAARGLQQTAIGWNQLAILYPPARLARIDRHGGAHMIVLEIERDQPLTYHIHADWMRGRQINTFPSPQDWLGENQELATGLALR